MVKNSWNSCLLYSSFCIGSWVVRCASFMSLLWNCVGAAFFDEWTEFTLLCFFSFSQKVLQSRIISYSMHSLWYVKIKPRHITYMFRFNPILTFLVPCQVILFSIRKEQTELRHLYLQVLKESFKVYCAINEGIINLVEKVGPAFSFPSEVTRSLHVLFVFFPVSYMHILQFFEMPRHDAVKSLDIYKRAGLQVTLLSFFFLCWGPFRFHLTRVCLSMQAGNLSQFYEVCKGLELARNFQFPVLREVLDESLFVTIQYLRARTILLRYNCVFVFSSLHNLFLQLWRSIWETHLKWLTSQMGHW